MSYVRRQKARKTSPRSISSLPDSTQKLSRKEGRVIPANCALSECFKLRVQSRMRLRDTNHPNQSRFQPLCP